MTNKVYILDDADYLLKSEKENDNVIYTLTSTNNNKWVNDFQNKEIIRIVDHGNGLNLSSQFIKELDLSYSDAVELFLILGQIKGLGTDNIIVK